MDKRYTIKIDDHHGRTYIGQRVTFTIAICISLAGVLGEREYLTMELVFCYLSWSSSWHIQKKGPLLAPYQLLSGRARSTTELFVDRNPVHSTASG